MKRYSNTLKSKKLILPYINTGQAPSSLLVDLYCKNLENSKKYNYVYLLSNVLDNTCWILNHTKLIKIFDILIRKLKNIL